MWKKKRNIFNKFVTEAKAINKDRYSYPDNQILKNTKSKAKIICKLHGPFYQSYDAHIYRKSNCPKCKADSISKALKDRYKKNKNNFSKKYEYSKKNPSEIKNDLIKKHNGKYLYIEESIRNIKNADSFIDIICPVHGLFKKKLISHMEGSECVKCNIETRRKANEEAFIEKAKNIFKDKYSYNNVKYISNKINVDIVCKLHGSFSVRPDNHLNLKHGCPVCSASKGERRVFEILTKLGFNFIREFKITGYIFKYDFYIPELNLIIEYDGKHHYEGSTFVSRNLTKIQHGKTWKEKRSLNLGIIQERDREKDFIAISNGFNIERISYVEYKCLDKELILKINKRFKYFYNGKFYINFLDLCRKNSFPNCTTLEDCKKYCSIAYLTNKIK